MSMCRMTPLHRALKRAGLTGISRTDGQGNSSTLWAGPECSGNRSAIGQPGPVIVPLTGGWTTFSADGRASRNSQRLRTKV